MSAFTVERVAALAGASKMTIYKWWPSKGVLALEGYASTVDSVLAVPDTGDVEADLTTQLLTFVRLLRDTPAGRVTAELLGAAQTDPELATALRDSYAGPRRAVGVAALRTAQERGQVRLDADPEVLIDQLWGACVYRLMVAGEPLTDCYARSLVQNLMRGIRVAGPPSVSTCTPRTRVWMPTSTVWPVGSDDLPAGARPGPRYGSQVTETVKRRDRPYFVLGATSAPCSPRRTTSTFFPTTAGSCPTLKTSSPAATTTDRADRVDPAGRAGQRPSADGDVPPDHSPTTGPAAGASSSPARPTSERTRSLNASPERR